MNRKSLFNELKSRLTTLRIGSASSTKETLDISLSETELLEDLERSSGNNRLLGRFSAEQVSRALAEYGVWKELESKGFAHPALTIVSIDPFRQRLRILADMNASEETENILGELRVFDAHLHGPCPITGENLEIDALVIDWLNFQNPKASFTAERPPLPGQQYPGLGILRTSIRAILDLAKETGKEAVINIPEYYHNAVLYHPAFHFLSAYVEGRFVALMKFLSEFTLAEASNLVHSQNIFNLTKNEVFVWQPHEQMLGLVPSISDYLRSPQYMNAVKEAEADSHFTLK